MTADKNRYRTHLQITALWSWRSTASTTHSHCTAPISHAWANPWKGQQGHLSKALHESRENKTVRCRFVWWIKIKNNNYAINGWTANVIRIRFYSMPIPTIMIPKIYIFQIRNGFERQWRHQGIKQLQKKAPNKCSGFMSENARRFLKSDISSNWDKELWFSIYRESACSSHSRSYWVGLTWL